MQGFGFVSAILRQNWWPCTTTIAKVLDCFTLLLARHLADVLIVLISDVIRDVKWTTKVPSPLNLARHAMQIFPTKYLAQHTHANVIHPSYHTGQYIYCLENLILLDKIFTTPPLIMIAKSSFETSPKQPRTTWHHNAAGTSQVALWRHECDA